MYISTYIYIYIYIYIGRWTCDANWKTISYLSSEPEMLIEFSDYTRGDVAWNSTIIVLSHNSTRVPWYQDHAHIVPSYYRTIILVPWSYSTMVLRHQGTIVPWCYSSMVLSYPGTVVPQNRITTVAWYYSNAVLQYQGTMVPWFYNTMAP